MAIPGKGIKGISFKLDFLCTVHCTYDENLSIVKVYPSQVVVLLEYSSEVSTKTDGTDRTLFLFQPLFPSSINFPVVSSLL